MDYLEPESQEPLLRALLFMWTHRSELTYEVQGDRLIVSPTSAALKYVGAIRIMKPQLIHLVETTHWSETTAARLFEEAFKLGVRLCAGKSVEVIEFAQLERPELWQEAERINGEIDVAQKARDMRRYNRAVCRYVEHRMSTIAAWKESETTSKEAA